MASMVEIMKNQEFMKSQKVSIFNDVQWATYRANFNQAHSMDKCKVSFTQYVNNLVYSMIDDERVSNGQVQELIDLSKYLLNDEKQTQFANLTANGLNFKMSVVEILTSTKKVGVITEKTDTDKKQSIGLKVARGERILRDLFLTILSDTYITKIEKKADKQKADKKAKKTTSKK